MPRPQEVDRIAACNETSRVFGSTAVELRDVRHPLLPRSPGTTSSSTIHVRAKRPERHRHHLGRALVGLCLAKPLHGSIHVGADNLPLHGDDGTVHRLGDNTGRRLSRGPTPANRICRWKTHSTDMIGVQWPIEQHRTRVLAFLYSRPCRRDERDGADSGARGCRCPPTCPVSQSCSMITLRAGSRPWLRLVRPSTSPTN